MKMKAPKGYEFCDEAYAPGPDDFALNWHGKLGYWLCYKGVQLGSERRWIRPVGVSEEGEHVCRLDGSPCDKHAGQIHGQEAEELRRGIERILETFYDDEAAEVDIDTLLRRLLDETDASDSLAFLETKPEPDPSFSGYSGDLGESVPNCRNGNTVDSNATKRIFKYELQPSCSGVRSVFMPFGARVISAGWQGGKLCVWAIVDETTPMAVREFKVVATGETFPELLATMGRCSVFHVRALYDETPEELFVFDVGA